LEEEFFKLNDFHTTIRGIKVRGVFSSEAEASIRAKRLQKSDPNFNIYMGAVGKWMAWEPDANKVTDQEYANEQLNTLMKKYRENEEAREGFYNEQKNSKIGTAKTRDPSSTPAVSVPSETTLKPTASASGAGAVAVAVAEAAVEVAEVAAAVASGSSYDAMFSGLGDLAIARKMEKLEKSQKKE